MFFLAIFLFARWWGRFRWGPLAVEAVETGPGREECCCLSRSSPKIQWGEAGWVLRASEEVLGSTVCPPTARADSGRDKVDPVFEIV